uniref:Protein CutA, chloroplastic n=1 Tax=Populus davidiana TaxID=266767 RepID=A0A6M2EJ23_9ROSI
MASSVFSRATSILPSTTIRRRLPLVGAFCMISLGLSNLCPTTLSSSSLKTGSAQSLPFIPLLRSKFGSSQAAATQATNIRMEGNSDTVPSIVVYVTVPNREAGKKLANSIVKEKLAACVNIVPGIESVYQWQGEIQSDAEELLIIKTRQSLLEALTEHVKANHEYEVPEVISLPITGGSIPYLKWLKDSTRD